MTLGRKIGFDLDLCLADLAAGSIASEDVVYILAPSLVHSTHQSLVDALSREGKIVVAEPARIAGYLEANLFAAWATILPNCPMGMSEAVEETYNGLLVLIEMS